MTALHAYFHLRNQQAFQRLLDPSRGQHRDSGGPSTSGGKSWSRPSPLSSAPSCDVNARDHLGRTVLHLAASSTDPSAPEFVRLLLAHPTINVNVPDAESHWTALHRALYHGNIATALLLLQKPDIDTSLRDVEGYTAFDLYNSTVEGTVPDRFSDCGKELYTWGSNRNAALGVGDGDDRAIPELVSLRISPVSEKENLDARFTPIRVREIAMSRLHTVIVTDEPRGNLRVCGFGSGGRLGVGQHTQYIPIPLAGFNLTVTDVAVGQDHTLILTRNGEVYSWGLNRFSQLGYLVETTTGGRLEEPIQTTPRKISGFLKNRTVIGVAACKTASVCWTDDEVFTWGTNNGQLGYDRVAHPIQVAPRMLTKINRPVLSVSITDSALACLLETQEVVCLWNDGHFKVNFPAYSFPSEFVAYRPPPAANRNSASIDKITSCDDTFAALSSSGEVFTFSLPPPPEVGSSTSKSRFNVQPQRVWALRKQFSAVTDVSLGADGSIIICTESGHVFIRTRNLKAGQGSSSKAFRFQRVPCIQRITQVRANATGAFAALRSDWTPKQVCVVGNKLAQDLATIQPYLRLRTNDAEEHGVGLSLTSPGASASHAVDGEDSDEEEEDASVQSDIKQLKALCSIVIRIKEARKGSDGTNPLNLHDMPYDADLVVHVQSAGIDLPAHRVILASRSPVLYQVLSKGKTVSETRSSIAVQGHFNRNSSQKHARIIITGCHPLSVLIIMVYLYSDDPLAVWDHRIGHALQRQLEQLKVKPAQLKGELQSLAFLLELPALSDVLDAPVKRAPKPTLARDMQQLFAANQGGRIETHSRWPLAADVALQLSDREVSCHSVVLRARSPFFAAFFGDKDWTTKRWTPEGTISVNLKHMKWRAVEPVLKYLCCGGDREIFDIVEDVRSVDELLEFMFDVMAVANEQHIERLMLICSWIIMKRVWINNVCSVLADATHYHARPLVRLLQEYIAINMDLFLESRMLEDLTPDLIKELSIFVRAEQAKKYPLSRSDFKPVIERAMEAWGDWLAQEDIPQPIVPSFRAGAVRDKDSPRLSPPGSMKKTMKRSAASAPSSPMLRPTFSTRSTVTGIPDDEMFVMDEPEIPMPPSHPVSAPGPPTRVASASESPGKPISGWKMIMSAPKADMKAIIAEASTTKAAQAKLPPPSAQLPGPPRALSSRPSFESSGKVGATSGSWRIPQAAPATPSGGSPNASSALISPGQDSRRQQGTTASIPSPSAAVVPSTAPKSQPTTPRKPVAPGLGPVFTPTKQASVSATASIRRVSSGNVWTPPPVQPVVQSSSTGSVMSFAAIQLSQAEQDVMPTKKDKRSLVEIQEEERARQIEEDFLRWWAAEEERLKAEEAATRALLAGASPKRPKKSRSVQKGKTSSSVPSASMSEGGGHKAKGGANAPDASAPKQFRNKHRSQGVSQSQAQAQPHPQGEGQIQNEGRGEGHGQGEKPPRRGRPGKARGSSTPDAGRQSDT